MNAKEVLSSTIRYKFWHLFPCTRSYRNMRDEMRLSDSSLSSFLFAVKEKEGKGGLLLANLAFSLLSLAAALAVDIIMPELNLRTEYFILCAFVYTVLLSLKFGFIRLTDFRNIGEMVFTLLSLFFTRLFSLTLIALIIFENSEALSTGEAAL